MLYFNTGNQSRVAVMEYLTRRSANPQQSRAEQAAVKAAEQETRGTEQTAEEESHSRAGGTICFYSATFFPSDRERTENI